jgi:hypothetical protein
VSCRRQRRAWAPVAPRPGPVNWTHISAPALHRGVSIQVATSVRVATSVAVASSVRASIRVIASIRVTTSICLRPGRRLRPHRGGQASDGGHHHGGPRRRGGGGQARDSGGAAPSILDVEAQPRWRRSSLDGSPLLRQPNDDGHGSGHGDGDGGSIGRAWIWAQLVFFKNPFFVSVSNDRYYKLFIFCIVQIVSFAGADMKYRFQTDTTNTFCSSVFNLRTRPRLGLGMHDCSFRGSTLQPNFQEFHRARLHLACCCPLHLFFCLYVKLVQQVRSCRVRRLTRGGLCITISAHFEIWAYKVYTCLVQS